MIADQFAEIGRLYRERVGRPFYEAEGVPTPTTPAQPAPDYKCKRDCGVGVHGVIRLCDRSCYK